MKYTITIDWLELLCFGTINHLNEIKKEKYTYEVSPVLHLIKNDAKHNPGFTYTFNVNYHGKLFANMYYGNNGKYRYERKDTILIAVANERLYEHGYSEKLNMIIQELKIEFEKISLLHVAIDGLDLIKEHNKLVNLASVKRQQRVKIKPELDEERNIHKSYVIGSPKSDRYITIYPKQQELEREYKPYIYEFWEQNNLKPSEGQQVDRLEIRFRKSDELKCFDKDFSKLESPAYLATFFKQQGGKYINFIYRKSKREVSLIAWSAFGDEIEILKPDQVKYAPVKKSTLTAIKVSLQAFRDTEKQIYLDSAIELSNDKGLNDIVAKRAQRWLREL